MATAGEIIKNLREISRPDQLEGMARFGITTSNRLGISIPELRKLARKLGKDHQLALDLWQTGIEEARILAGMIADPQELTPGQMDDWVKDMDSWDVCDQVSMNLFDKSPYAITKIYEWAERPEEFVKRSAFSLIACVAWHDKAASDESFIALLPVIEKASTDERNYVKKAVNWALRHIGKRNRHLNEEALMAARRIQAQGSKSARWIASDAIRELESPAVQARLK